MYHATKNNAVLNLTSSRSCGRQNMRDIKTLLTAPISRIKTLRDDEGRKDKENVGQVLPDNQIKRHSRMSLSGIPTAFNNAQGGDPRTLRAAFSGMTTNFNSSPLPLPSPSWRGNTNNPLPSRGGRCPVRADEGGNHNTLAKPLPSPRSVGMRGIRGASPYPALQACGMTSETSTPAKCGFTLIELLVVVLIIGILAAIALPQYQKAVERASALQAITLLRAVVQAQQFYFTEYGTYPLSFEQLTTITMPGTPYIDPFVPTLNARVVKGWAIETATTDTCAGAQLHRLNEKDGRINIAYHFKCTDGRPLNQMLCTENTTSVKKPGIYCQKILQGTLAHTSSGYRWYILKK